MKAATLTVEKSRELDRRAELEYGLPTLLLMESAGRGLADIIQRNLISPTESCRVAFVCGAGNNGGDGFVAARHLTQRGVPVAVFLLAPESEMKGDAAINFRIIRNIGVAISPFESFAAARKKWDRQPVLILDAILGTGFRPPLRPETAEAIRQINNLKKFHTSAVKVMAVDIPTGLNGDTGPTEGEMVRADITVTFACYKPGLLNSESRPYVGRVELVDIGIPEKLMRSVKDRDTERSRQ